MENIFLLLIKQWHQRVVIHVAYKHEKWFQTNLCNRICYPQRFGRSRQHDQLHQPIKQISTLKNIFLKVDVGVSLNGGTPQNTPK